MTTCVPIFLLCSCHILRVPNLGSPARVLLGFGDCFRIIRVVGPSGRSLDVVLCWVCTVFCVLFFVSFFFVFCYPEGTLSKGSPSLGSLSESFRSIHIYWTVPNKTRNAAQASFAWMIGRYTWAQAQGWTFFFFNCHDLFLW